MCVTWLICVCDTTHPCVWHDSPMCVTWFIRESDMTYSYVCHGSFICVVVTHSYVWSWLIHMCAMTHWYVWHDSFTCARHDPLICVATYESCHTHMCGHDSFIRVICLLHMCAMTHWYVWHDSFTCARHDSLICVATTLSCVWYASFIRVAWLIHTSRHEMHGVVDDMLMTCWWHVDDMLNDMTHLCVRLVRATWLGHH